MNWTDEMVDELKALDAQCVPFSAIAEALNQQFGAQLTRSAVAGKRSRQRLPPRPAATQSKAPARPRKRRVKPRKGPKALPPKPVRPIADTEPIGIMELKNNTCRWPIEAKGGFVFCGRREADMENRRPYCAAHTEEALQ